MFSHKTFMTILSWIVCVCVCLCFYDYFLFCCFGFVFVSSCRSTLPANVAKYFDDNAISLYSMKKKKYCFVWFGSLFKISNNDKVSISHHTPVPISINGIVNTQNQQFFSLSTYSKWSEKREKDTPSHSVECCTKLFFWGKISFYKWSFLHITHNKRQREIGLNLRICAVNMYPNIDLTKKNKN